MTDGSEEPGEAGPRRPPPTARRALAEAEARRAEAERRQPAPKEFGGGEDIGVRLLEGGFARPYVGGRRKSNCPKDG